MEKDNGSQQSFIYCITQMSNDVRANFTLSEQHAFIQQNIIYNSFVL